MRIFHIEGDQFAELNALPDAAPAEGDLWIGSTRTEFDARVGDVQSALQRWTGGQLVDLHILDLLNDHLPSHFDYTSWYDVLVFRRLATTFATGPAAPSDAESNSGPVAWPRSRESTPARSASRCSTGCF